MGRFQRGGGPANRSFGNGGGSRGGFRGGRGGGGNRSFGKFGGGGNRSFNDSGDSGNRSFNRGGGKFRRGGGNWNSFGNEKAGGGNRNFFGGGGNRNSSGGDKVGSSNFFKKQSNGFNGNKQNKKSFDDNRKRKFDSDSDEEEQMIEKPKNAVKIPRLDVSTNKFGNKKGDITIESKLSKKAAATIGKKPKQKSLNHGAEKNGLDDEADFDEDVYASEDDASDDDQTGGYSSDEVTDKPKGILKTPHSEVATKLEKKNVKMNTKSNNSFQTKTPSTPHPAKKSAAKFSETPLTLKSKTLNFNSDDDEDDEYGDDESNSKVPQLETMDFEDSDDDLESYEDISGDEDEMSDLEDEDLARLGGAEDSDEEMLEEEEMDADIPSSKQQKKKTSAAKPVKSTIKSDDDEEESISEGSQDKKLSSKKTQKEAESPVKSAAKSSGLSPAAVKAEIQLKMQFLSKCLYIAKSADQAKERKSLAASHPLLVGAWKQGSGILLVFDSDKSRKQVLKFFKQHAQAEYNKLELLNAEEVKSLVEEPTENADSLKLHFLHLPDRFNKKHLSLLFPAAETHEMPGTNEGIVTFKSSDAAQKMLESLHDLKLFGLPVMIKYFRGTAK